MQQKLVYLNEYVELVDDAELKNKMTASDITDWSTIKHPKIGVVAASNHQIYVLTRPQEVFEQARTFPNLIRSEFEVSRRRLENRIPRTVSSRIPGLPELVGGVRTSPNAYSHLLYRRRNVDVWRILKPLDADRHVGIELELCSVFSEAGLLRNLKKHELGRYVSVANDGSIEPDGDWGECDCDYDDEYGHADDCASNSRDTGMEFRILCKESELSHVAKLIDDFTQHTNCYVNDSCGLHVHLDMRTRDVEECYSNLYNNLDHLYARVNDSRLSNTYCKRNTRSNFDSHNSLEDRYYAINTMSYDEHSTLEVRLHHGTIQGETIKNWVNFLINTIDNANINKFTADIAV